LNEVKKFYWDDPYLFEYCPDQIFRRCIPDNEVSNVIKLCHSEACGTHFSSKKTTAKILQYGFYWPTMFKDTHVFCKACENCQKSGFISKHKESLDNLLLTFETYPGGDVHRAFQDLWHNSKTNQLDMTKRLMSFLKCKSVKVINNLARPGSDWGRTTGRLIV